VLAVALLLWSGIFPFLKLLLTAFVDRLGKNRDNPPGSRWRLVSFLSKLSFIDVWIVALTVLFVRLDLKKRQSIYLRGTLLSRKLRIEAWAQAEALRGVYFFAMALVINQFLFHFVLQRAMYGQHLVTVQFDAMAPLQLKPLMHRSLHSKFDTAISVCSLFSVAGLMIGSAIPFVHMDLDVHIELVQAGLVNEHVDMGLHETYSVVTAASQIGTVTHHIGRGNAALAALTFAFVVIAPLLQCVCTSALWFCPLSAKGQRAFAGIIDVLSVVAAADCFGVVASLMVWQLPLAFASIEEATQYASLSVTPLFGLYLFTLAGFMGTISSYWVHHKYMVTIRDEAAEAAAAAAGASAADVQMGHAIAKALISRTDSGSDKADVSVGIDDLESGLALGSALIDQTCTPERQDIPQNEQQAQGQEVNDDQRRKQQAAAAENKVEKAVEMGALTNGDVSEVITSTKPSERHVVAVFNNSNVPGARVLYNEDQHMGDLPEASSLCFTR
jgi:hypothetical protein